MACFYVTLTQNFEPFQYFNFETNFLKKSNPFQKTGEVESTKIDNTAFQYKTALSEANVKTNRMWCTNWTYRKGNSFVHNYFVFPKISFQFNILV